MIKTDHIKRYVIELENIEERLNQDSFTKESTMFNYRVQRRDEIKDMVDKYLKMTQGASDNGKENRRCNSKIDDPITEKNILPPPP